MAQKHVFRNIAIHRKTVFFAQIQKLYLLKKSIILKHPIISKELRAMAYVQSIAQSITYVLSIAHLEFFFTLELGGVSDKRFLRIKPFCGCRLQLSAITFFRVFPRMGDVSKPVV